MSENALTIRVHGFIFHMVRVLLKNKSWERPIAYIKLKFNNYHKKVQILGTVCILFPFPLNITLDFCEGFNPYLDALAHVYHYMKPPHTVTEQCGQKFFEVIKKLLKS